MGQPQTSPGADGQAPEAQEPSSTSAWSDDDGLFDSTPSGELRWFAEARLLLNEALEKVLPQARGSAQRQIESLARQQGLSEITPELVGLVLGGMSSVNVDDSQ